MIRKPSVILEDPVERPHELEGEKFQQLKKLSTC